MSPTTVSIKTLFTTFLLLGLTSFGGPVAHLGYFREAFVVRRQWLTEKDYADLVALCQFLPGPASSQVGFAIGLLKGGYRGGLVAWLGFTLPSALALMLFALGITHYGNLLPAGGLHGLKIAAVAIVAHAIWGMGKNLVTERIRASIMIFAAVAVLLFPNAWVQVGVILAAALIGSRFLPKLSNNQTANSPIQVRSAQKRNAVVTFSLFVALLIGLPLLSAALPNLWLQQADSFYRAGSLVFGGGHVVLPLLQAEMLDNGWLNDDTFLAGYGAAQAVPGPLFTFAAFLGTAINTSSPWLSGLFCLVVIFIPSFLLLIAALPFWETLRHQAKAQTALAAVNAAVVGILLAALYQPIWQKAIFNAADFSLALMAFLLLNSWKLPAWAVVLGCGTVGILLG